MVGVHTKQRYSQHDECTHDLQARRDPLVGRPVVEVGTRGAADGEAHRGHRESELRELGAQRAQQLHRDRRSPGAKEDCTATPPPPPPPSGEARYLQFSLLVSYMRCMNSLYMPMLRIRGMPLQLSL